MYNLVDSPVFVSGHTRSGTNLLMRLLDGSPDLLVPPGVGKLNILRRLSWNSDPNESVEERYKRLLNDLELKLDSERLSVFQEVLKSQTLKSTTKGFKSDLNIILNSIRVFVGVQGNAGLNYWLEKNHNLEFYWSRAMLAFENPHIYVMVRDPRDVWGSWREELKRNNSNTSMEQMCRNIQQHMVEEILESSLGVGRFQNLESIIDYYKVPKSRYTLIDECLRNVIFNGIQSPEINREIIDPKAYKNSNCEAGRFAWNHRIISERAIWLEETYPQNALVVGYEELTNNPLQTIDRVTKHCGIKLPKEIAPTEIGKKWGGNSSFENSFGGVSTRSIGRWKDRLSSNEVDAIMDVSWETYKSAVKWSEEV